jgi:hypothetical protein
MTTDLTPRERGGLVEALSSSLKHGGDALGTVPVALKRLLQDGAWREFVTARGEVVHHERFADFVTEAPLRGLGADLALVRRIVATDAEALDLLDRELQNPSSRHAGNNIPGRPEGTSASKAHRRLRKDAPELHAEVLSGRMSAHAAMVQAGLRPKTVSVPVTRPEAVARSLLRYMSADDIAKLIRALTEQAGHGSTP